MMFDQRVVEVVCLNVQGEAAAPDRRAALELVEVDVDALVVERLERRLEAAVGNKRLHIPFGDAGMLEETAVGAVARPEDASRQDREEPLAALRQCTAADARAPCWRIDGLAQIARQA
jgi:hypothetical protein